MTNLAAGILTLMAWLRRPAAVAAAATLVFAFGFPAERGANPIARGVELGVVLIFLLDLAASGMLAADVWRRERVQRALLLGGVAVVAAGSLAGMLGRSELGAAILLSGAQVFLLARLLRWLVRSTGWLLTARIRPTWIMIGAYLALIGLGTLLLALPGARAEGVRAWRVSDAFFTSTSAACVTGLAVRDVGSELSWAGQVVLLALIQVGGLGPVTLMMFAGLMARRGLNMRQALALREMLSVDFVGDLRRFMAFVLASTAVIELLGAALLFVACPLELRLFERAWWALFHSVSAFCNAGFGLHADSLVALRGNTAVCIPVMALIVLGGVGFPVLLNLASVRLSDATWYRRRLARHGQAAARPPTRLSLQSKLAVTMTAILLVAGTLVFFWREADGVLASESPATAWLISAFQSVAPRTAGFNSIDLAELRRDTQLMILGLMVIGAAPVSTGGGVRVVAVAVVVLTVRALARGSEHVSAFRRTIPRSVIGLSVTIVALYLAVLGIGVAVLIQTQPALPFGALLFEAVSALSTVGLTLGATTAVDDIGRAVLCGLMFIGRIGPLALLWSFVSRAAVLRYQYPEENVVVS